MFRTFAVPANGLPVRIVPSGSYWRRVLLGQVTSPPAIFITASASQIGTVNDLVDAVTAVAATSFVLPPDQALYAIAAQAALAPGRIGVHISDHVTWARLPRPDASVPRS